MVIPDSAGDASSVRMHAYKTYTTYSKYRIYKFMNVPVLSNIQPSSNQYISTGYEPGYHYYLNLTIFPMISFIIFNQ